MQDDRIIKTIIIDDELSAILLLEELLLKIDGVKVVGNANDIKKGVNTILNLRPDIVFLDIRLNDEKGFDLIKELKNYDFEPLIVMVTGYDQFVLDAIKAGAFDYLLKPVDPDELIKVIERFRQKKARYQIQTDTNKARVLPESIQKIRFNTLGGFILINPEEILYCKAEANYTDIFLVNQQKHTISLNIGNVGKIIGSPEFFRISRSAIINVKYLTEINRGKRLCTLTAGQFSIPLSIAHNRIKELEFFLYSNSMY
jgi:DNA-binding LytR/AlgR family response regulator